MINDALFTPDDLEFKNDKIDVDYSFVDEGIVVTNDYISLLFDGTFKSAQTNATSSSSNKRYTRMPLHDPDGAEIQLMISEYSLNSMLLTAVDLNVMSFENSE